MSTPWAFANGAQITLDYAGVTGAAKATTTYTGENTLDSDASIIVQNSGGGTAEVIFSGSFSDGGSGFGLTKIGAQTMTLSAANTYSGDTIVGEGVLQLSGSGSIGDASLVVISNGATMSLNDISDTIKGLSGAGAVTLGSGTLTTSNAATDTFSGAVTGTGGFVKDGSGTQILSGENTYSGGTTISAGVLSVGAGSTTGSISGNVVNNATLQFNRSDDLGFSGAISGTGAVTKLGAGTLTLSGAGSYAGATTVSAGTLELADTDGAAAGSTIPCPWLAAPCCSFRRASR